MPLYIASLDHHLLLPGTGSRSDSDVTLGCENARRRPWTSGCRIESSDCGSRLRGARP